MTLLSELTINRQDPRTVSEQIVAHIMELAADGRLPTGARLPSLRDLAARLGVSCNATVHAYEVLTDRGYIAPRPCAGYYVLPQQSPRLGGGLTAPRSSEVSPRSSEVSPRSSQAALRPAVVSPPEPPGVASHLWSPSDDGLGDDLWAQDDLHTVAHHRRLWFDGRVRAGERPGEGVKEVLLQESLLQGVPLAGCSSIELMGSLAQALVVTLSALGLRPGQEIWIEEPCDPTLARVVAAMGLRSCPVRRTAEGLEWQGDSSGPRVFVVVPTFHNPTGSVLSMPQRVALMERAHRAGVWVVELNLYDGLYFRDVCQTSLASLVHGEGVVSIVPCGALLSGWLQSHAVLCADEPLAKAIGAWREQCCDPRSHAWEWAILDELMAGDVRKRQLARLRKILAMRWQNLQTLLQSEVAQGALQGLSWSPMGGGLYLWLEGASTATRADTKPTRAVVIGAVFGRASEWQKCVRVNIGQLGYASHVVEALSQAPNGQPTKRSD